MSAHPLSFSDVTARPRMAPPTAFPFPEFALSGPAFAGPASAAPLAASAVVARPAASVADGAGLAHDAGNLMGALGLYSALLSRPDVLRPEHRHYAEELTLLSQRSRALIDRLLVGSESLPATAPAATTEDVPTKNSGPSRRTADRPADAGSCDPHWVLDQLAPLLRSLAAPHELSLHSSGPRTTLPFSAEILERIAVNLVCNATQAMTTQATNTQTTNKQATPAVAASLRHGRAGDRRRRSGNAAAAGGPPDHPDLLCPPAARGSRPGPAHCARACDRYGRCRRSPHPA
jgi:hypothetical protein